MVRVLVAVLIMLEAVTPAAAEPTGGIPRHASDDAEEALENPHQPQHGGLFGDADDLYHYELVFDAPNQLRLYVNDERNRPLNTRALQGRWEIFPGTAEAVSGAFVSSIDGGYFLAALPKTLPGSFPVEISVQKGQLWAAMEFAVSAPPSASR